MKHPFIKQCLDVSFEKKLFNPSTLYLQQSSYDKYYETHEKHLSSLTIS